MADLKISQLPAAVALTGSELIELVQSGGNVQSTTGAIGATATPAALLTPIQTENWFQAIANGNSGTLPPPFGPGNSSVSASFTTNGAGASGKGVVPGSTSMYNATSTMLLPQSGTALNSKCEITFNAESSYGASYRKTSGGLPNAGFTWVFVGGFDTTRADQIAFFGMKPFGLLGATPILSNILNIVGFGKEQADANLQFMVNNGAGVAAKTDTGLLFTSLTRHLFQITITCDPLGAKITATIRDLEVNSPFATKTFTVLDGAAKNIVVDTKIWPDMYLNTGTATTTAVVMGWSSFFLATSFVGPG